MSKKSSKAKPKRLPGVGSSEMVRCVVVFPHFREINGTTYMLEPMFSGIVALPNDSDTKKCIKRGWLKVVAPNDQAEAPEN